MRSLLRSAEEHAGRAGLHRRVQPRHRHAERAADDLPQLLRRTSASACRPARSPRPSARSSVRTAGRRRRRHRRALRAALPHRPGSEAREVPLAQRLGRSLSAGVSPGGRESARAAGEHVPDRLPLRSLLQPGHCGGVRRMRPQRRHADRTAQDVPALLHRRQRRLRAAEPDSRRAGVAARERQRHRSPVACASRRELADSSFKPPACNSLGGGEGRCLAPCIPAIAAQASRLPQSTCAANRVCAPCYDPTITPATPSGACSINGDAPKRRRPTRSRSAARTRGPTRGTCVPLSVAGSVANGLPQDTCPGPDAGADAVKCVPDQKVRDQNLQVSELSGCRLHPRYLRPSSTGRLRSGLRSTRRSEGFLDRNTCAAGELCAPCEFPPGSGTRTGACD